MPKIPLAIGWREIHFKEQDIKKAARLNKIAGAVLMGLFGAFTAVLFFYGSTCSL